MIEDKKYDNMSNAKITTCYHCGKEFRVLAHRLYCTSKCEREDQFK